MKLIFKILAILFSTLVFSQTKTEKINYIIKTTGILEGYKSLFIDTKINPLKYEVNKKDSLKLEKIISKVTDEEISKRLSKGYAEVFTNKEIDDIYLFFNSAGGKKFTNSNDLLGEKFEDNFKDIESEINNISENSITAQQTYNEEKVQIPVYADREDGFYAVLNDVKNNVELKNLKLSPKPAVTSKDFLKIKKVKDQLGRNTIDITLTKEGAKKFKELTAENIGKPIAIVLKKELVSAPNVMEEIAGGRIQVSGDFSDEEINNIIESFKK